MRTNILPLPGTAPETPRDVDLSRFAKIFETTPEENRAWNKLPESYRLGFQHGFNLALEFTMKIEKETRRRKEQGLTPEEASQKNEAHLLQIFQSALG
jgi:hypothetical protein